jgi:hypothetical protein
MGLRRRVAAFFCDCVGYSAPFIPERFGHTNGNQTRGHTRVGPEHDGFLYHRVRLAHKTTGSIQWLGPASLDFPQRRLRREPAQEIGLGRCNLGKGSEFEVPQIKQQQRGRLG